MTGGAHERLKAELAWAGRTAVAAGLVVGSGGNLSVRVPDTDEAIVTAAGTWLDQLETDSFAVVRISDGSRVDGPAPSTEYAMHLAAYRARRDVTAVIHLHPQATVLLDSVGERIRLITTDHAVYVRSIAATPVLRPGTVEVAEATGAAVADGTNCVILPYHGCCVVGDSVAMAYRRATNLEEAARLTYRALLLTGGLEGREITECPIDFSSTSTV